MAAARLRVSVATPDSAPAGPAGASARHTASRGLGQWLARVAPATARGDLSVAVVSDRRMRALNRQFRGKDKVTDVLSFPASDQSMPSALSAAGFLGDVVIAAGVAEKQAREAGHTVQTEVRVLALHGLLHLLGYDHESDNGTMARVESRLRKKAGLKEGLIERQRPSARLRSLRVK
jgi:probable rRNA maturation factor